MSSANVEPFIKHLRPLAILCRIFGIVQFSTTRTNVNGKAKKNNCRLPDYVRSIPFLIMYICVSGYAFKLQLSQNYANSSVIRKTGDIVPMGVSVLSMYIRYAYYGRYRNQYKKLLLDISTSSNKLKTLPNNTTSFRFNLKLILSLFLFGYCVLFIIDVSIAPSITGVIFYITFSSALFTGVLDSLLAVVVLNELTRMFRILNEQLAQPITFLQLEGLVPEKIQLESGKQRHLSAIKGRSKRDYLVIVHGLVERHCSITELCKRANRLYTVPLLGVIGTGFIFIVNSGQAFTYNIFAHYMIGRDYKLYQTVFFGFWSLLELIHLFFTIRAWAKLSKEASNTSTHIHEIWNNLALHNEIDDSTAHLQLISMQLLNSKLKFTANGLFPLDLTLFQMILKAVTTYIVILIQFEISAAKKAAQKLLGLYVK